MIGLESADNFF